MLNATLLPLRSDRAVLRIMRPSDARAYAAGTADPAVREFAHLPEPEYTESSVTALIEGTIRDDLERGDLAVLAIADPDTDAFGGSAVLFGVEGTSVEVGFWVHPDYRGREFAASALTLAQEFVRRSGLTTIKARTALENHMSQRILERSGFVRTGMSREVAPSGHELSLLLYALDIE